MSKIIILSILLLSGCTNTKDIGCNLSKQGTKYLSDLIATSLACNNPKEIHKDFVEVLYKMNICKKDDNLAQLIAVCPMISDMILSLGQGSIPKDWECKTGIDNATAKEFLTKVCERALPKF